MVLLGYEGSLFHCAKVRVAHTTEADSANHVPTVHPRHGVHWAAHLGAIQAEDGAALVCGIEKTIVLKVASPGNTIGPPFADEHIVGRSEGSVENRRAPSSLAVPQCSAWAGDTLWPTRRYCEAASNNTKHQSPSRTLRHVLGWSLVSPYASLKSRQYKSSRFSAGDFLGASGSP
eukprot:CAMPEP_0114261982 /NCGR_PEP_ID=MMETSP0058-20121206/21488_1 /TAXON_ID=36894 /ORGANISM="Pyramimonas parkeae, CCMP726" /LENGTH=174 /DNA_ID=CAMNT_0001377675 /DNA_START=401 /DNA_END=926 /DNA_ORIENTATION=-